MKKIVFIILMLLFSSAAFGQTFFAALDYSPANQGFENEIDDWNSEDYWFDGWLGFAAKGFYFFPNRLGLGAQVNYAVITAMEYNDRFGNESSYKMSDWDGTKSVLNLSGLIVYAPLWKNRFILFFGGGLNGTLIMDSEADKSLAFKGMGVSLIVNADYFFSDHWSVDGGFQVSWNFLARDAGGNKPKMWLLVCPSIGIGYRF